MALYTSIKFQSLAIASLLEIERSSGLGTAQGHGSSLTRAETIGAEPLLKICIR
jgi:hypothetical protein